MIDERDFDRMKERIELLEDQVERLDIECLIGRYMIGGFVAFYLAREPEERRKIVFNMIFGEARAWAEIDGWSKQFDSIFEFDGDDAKGFIRKRSRAAPFYL